MQPPIASLPILLLPVRSGASCPGTAEEISARAMSYRFRMAGPASPSAAAAR